MKKRSLQFSKEFPFFMAAPAILWQVLFFYIPLLIIIIMSVIKRLDTTVSFTLSNYAHFLKPIYLGIIGRSLLLATINATLCVILAYPVAYYLARRVKKGKNILLFFLILPFWTNVLVQVYAWFFVLEKYGLLNSVLVNMGIISEPLSILNTPIAVYLVMLYCYIPFAIMPIYSIVEKLDTRILEASYDLGATPWQTFTRVILPMSASGITTAFFLVFIASFGEFVIPMLMGGGKQMYVGTLMYHYFLVARNYSWGSAFTGLSMCILVLCAGMIYMILKKQLRITKRGN
jgi:spermidine/putrescine transport system permease protein